MAEKKEYTCVLVETDDEGITWITFNRPEKRNAMNPTLARRDGGDPVWA